MSLPTQTWSLHADLSDNRDFLIRFWFAAPADQLEQLWNSSFGSATINLVKQLSVNTIFTPEQVLLRTQLGDKFNRDGLSDPLACQFMIVNFLLSPPGLLTINNVESLFPLWFSNAYNELYVSGSSANSIVYSPSVDAPSTSVSPSDFPKAPDFGPFPSSLKELSSNRIHLNRLLGLSNLYYIDPEDNDIRSELEIIRSSLALAISNEAEANLQNIWASDLGDRYWALVRSGIQLEPLSQADSVVKEDAVRRLTPSMNGGFGKPGSINAFLVAMMFFEPGTMTVPDAEAKIPSWLLSGYQQIFAKANS